MKNFCFKAGLILAILGGVFLFFTRTSIQIAYTEPVDIMVDGVDNPDEIKKGMAIQTDLNILMECFGSMETTTKNRRSGSTTSSTDYYFILPIFTEDETYYVAFEVDESSKNLSAYRAIANDTMDYLYMYTDELSSKSVKTNGGLHKLDKEVYGYMVEWFKDCEWFEDDSDIDKYVLPLVFQPQKTSSVKTMLYVFIGMIVVGIALFVVSFQIDKKYKPRKQQLESLDEKTVTINGTEYYIARLDEIDKAIWKGNTSKARNVLIRTYRAHPQEADYIIANWSQITGIN